MTTTTPYMLPERLWETADEWLASLVTRGVFPAAPTTDLMTTRMSGPTAVRLHIHGPDDVYAWADITHADGGPCIAAEEWGYYEPLHVSGSPHCMCDVCEEARR